MSPRQIAVVVAVSVFLGPVAIIPGEGAPADLDSLLEGVTQISAPGAPGVVCVFGDAAFAVVTGSLQGAVQAPVVAAARLGTGRIVALGHNGYFGRESLDTGDTARLMLNAVRWLAGETQPRVAVQDLPDLLALLQQQGIAAEALSGADWTSRLRGYNVLATTRAPAFNDEQVAAVAAFIRTGGGFLSGDTPWGWLQLNPGKSLTADHGGNQVLAAAGLVWADGFAGRTGDIGYVADRRPGELVHAGRALDAIEAQARGERQLSKQDTAQASWTVTHAARSLPPGDTILRPRLVRLQQEHAATAVPKPDAPLTLEQPLARLALTLQMEEIARLPAEQVTAHPSAEFFPGAVPADAARVSRTIQVDTQRPAWHSTGLYAAPGEAIEVRVPGAAAGKGLQVRIGCHTDGIWHLEAWKRCPEIVRAFPVGEPLTKAANAFGGPVYIDVPANSGLGLVEVEIVGAVEAPHFVLGKTDPVQWREQSRSRPAPWAELESPKVILTIPSSAIRAMDDPVPLMEFWVHVLDACAELAARPVERERPERYVADVQIGAGYMHSGYPIMTHTDVAPLVVDTQKLVTQGSWGHFHEMGHNHQSGDWTFDGTGEVTVNLFSLYVIDRCCHLSDPGHPAIAPDARAKKIAEHLAAGAPFERWQSDPFLALIMYMQLQEAFGWEAYRQVFAEYRDLPDAQRPQSDDEKRDQWLVRFSRTVGRNLGPFFQAWGVPTSEQARAAVADLPDWTPPDFPPKAP
jgi:hypothetical protein